MTYRPLGLALLAIALVVTGAPAAWRPFANPVRDLRQTLQAPVRNMNDLILRQNTLAQRATALQTLVELREALLLEEWRDQDADEAIARVDREARNAIVHRFEDLLNAVLQRGDARSRLAATNMLRELDGNLRGVNRQGGAARAVGPALVATLRHEDPALRESAMLALGRIDPDPAVAVPAIDGQLRAPGVAERRAAALGQLELVRALARSLKDRDPRAIREARDLVTRSGCAVLPVAARSLGDPDVEVRRLGLAALDELVATLADVIGVPRPAAVLDVGEPERYRGEVEAEAAELQPLTACLAQRLPALIAALRDADPEVRLAAHHAFESAAAVTLRLQFRLDSAFWPPPVPGQTPPPRRIVPLWQALCQAVPTLVQGVGDTDVRTRRAALGVLEILGPGARPAVPALTQALADADPFVRWAAARTLGKLGPVAPETTVPALARLLSDRDLDLRLTAASALARYGPAARAAVPALVQATWTGDVEERVAAIRALEAIGPDPHAVMPALSIALQHPDHRVRQAAVELVGRLGSTTETANLLQLAACDPDLAVRKAANDGLLILMPAGVVKTAASGEHQTTASRGR
jgi:HEAT repeat protein